MGLLADVAQPAAEKTDAGLSQDENEQEAEAGSSVAGAMMASLLNMMLTPQQQAGTTAGVPATASIIAGDTPVVGQVGSADPADAQLTLPQAPAPALPQVAATKPTIASAAGLETPLTVTADTPMPAIVDTPVAKPEPNASILVQQMAASDGLPVVDTDAMVAALGDKPAQPLTASVAPIVSAVADRNGDTGASGAGSGEADRMQVAETAGAARPTATADSAFAGLMAQTTDAKPPPVDATQIQAATGIKLENLAGQITPGEQVVVHLASRATNGDSHITVQLKPVELGTVDVRIETRQDGEISIHMRVERPETLDLLQRDARHLERALNEAGLKADSGSLSFSLRQDQGQAFADRRWLQQSAPGYQQGLQDTNSTTAEAVQAYRPTYTATDRIDITV